MTRPHGPTTAPGQAYNHWTERARLTWSQADFTRAGAEQVLVAELLCRAVDVHPGERVLDVAAGSGNAALAAGPGPGASSGPGPGARSPFEWGTEAGSASCSAPRSPC
jgi:hypothetical protein